MITSDMKLSILVCSVLNRGTTFLPNILRQLDEQSQGLDNVEVIVLADNKRMTVGAKRNKLLDLATGEYSVFVDDDDRISEDYVRSILEATESGKDAIVFQASVTINGGAPKVCYYSMKNESDYDTPKAYYRLPNHITAVKTSLARAARFPERMFHEDSDYAKNLSSVVESEHVINKVLYYYDYSDYTSETVRYDTERPRQAVDLVMMSKASTESDRQMTQRSIDTAINTTLHTVNVIVLEQVSGITYRNAQTFYKDEPFNYNAFANYGAEQGDSDWIVVANNDLIFRSGWLEELLNVDHPFVSPHEPNDIRQQMVNNNEIGKIIGRHMSGWCFMIKRLLWNDIGKFDTDVDFWCSDDVVVEQCAAKGVLSMVVKSAIVEHLGSQTFLREPNRNDLMWRNVLIFNTKYNANKFSASRDYALWMRQNPRLVQEIKERYSVRRPANLDVTVVVATHGDSNWEAMGNEAAKSAEKAGATVVRVHEQDSTLSQVRNKGLERVTTEYVTFLDADDNISEDYFNVTTNSDVTVTKISYGGSRPQHVTVYRHNEARYGHAGQLCSSECLKTGNFVHIGAIIKTEVAKKARFREYAIYEDWAYFLELSLIGATFGYADTVYKASVRINRSHRNRSMAMIDRNLVHAQIIKDLL